MSSTTRWLRPLVSRPADYPEGLPFLPDHGCMLSRSGAGESVLFSVMWSIVFEAHQSLDTDRLLEAHIELILDAIRAGNLEDRS